MRADFFGTSCNLCVRFVAPLGCPKNVQDSATIHGRCHRLQAQYVEVKPTGKSESESDPSRRTHLSIATNEHDNIRIGCTYCRRSELLIISTPIIIIIVFICIAAIYPDLKVCSEALVTTLPWLYNTMLEVRLDNLRPHLK